MSASLRNDYNNFKKKDKKPIESNMMNMGGIGIGYGLPQRMNQPQQPLIGGNQPMMNPSGFGLNPSNLGNFNKMMPPQNNPNFGRNYWYLFMLILIQMVFLLQIIKLLFFGSREYKQLRWMKILRKNNRKIALSVVEGNLAFTFFTWIFLSWSYLRYESSLIHLFSPQSDQESSYYPQPVSFWKLNLADLDCWNQTISR